MLAAAATVRDDLTGEKEGDCLGLREQGVEVNGQVQATVVAAKWPHVHARQLIHNKTIN